jgi:hypothetical protein
LEVLFDLPAAADGVDQRSQGDGGGGMTAVEGEFAGVAVAADDQVGVVDCVFGGVSSAITSSRAQA